MEVGFKTLLLFLCLERYGGRIVVRIVNDTVIVIVYVFWDGSPVPVIYGNAQSA